MRLTLGKIGWGTIATLFLMTPLFASSSKEEVKTVNTPAYNWAYTEEAFGLLQDIRTLSAQAVESTEHLNAGSRQNLIHWRSHAQYLSEIRTHVNTMGEKLERLQEIHGMIAPWQQKAVERLTPKAVALAGHTEEAIAHLNQYQSRLWVPHYTNRFAAMLEHGDEINRTVSMFLDFGKTSDRLEGLENQIEYTGA